MCCVDEDKGEDRRPKENVLGQSATILIQGAFTPCFIWEGFHKRVRKIQSERAKTCCGIILLHRAFGVWCQANIASSLHKEGH
eukprot:scaffold7350_cov233-Pinguiococcus_pyrenoidosus.AAC.2